MSCNLMECSLGPQSETVPVPQVDLDNELGRTGALWRRPNWELRSLVANRSTFMKVEAAHVDHKQTLVNHMFLLVFVCKCRASEGEPIGSSRWTKLGRILETRLAKGVAAEA